MLKRPKERHKPRTAKKAKTGTASLRRPRRSVAVTKMRRKTSKKPAKSVAKKQTEVQTPRSPKIVRIMGHGQFKVDSSTVKKLGQIDDSLVELVSKERTDDMEFRRRLAEMSELVTTKGKPIDPKEIIRSDIILPSPDLGLEEAKRLFRGDGVIPAT